MYAKRTKQYFRPYLKMEVARLYFYFVYYNKVEQLFVAGDEGGLVKYGT